MDSVPHLIENCSMIDRRLVSKDLQNLKDINDGKIKISDSVLNKYFPIKKEDR